jgi:tetratricopeptide (TPR) repeat protein
MFGRDQSGVAALVVMAIVATSTGVAIATPVVISAVHVDPDSPLYGLGRLGEQIRMVSSEDQMKTRWGEYVRMASRGKGLEYKYILEEFVNKMHEVAPENAETSQELAGWMQGQMSGIGLAKLGLMSEICEKLRENLPGASGWLENKLLDLENLRKLAENSNLLENIRARLELEAQRLRQFLENYENKLREDFENIDNILVDVDVTIKVRVNMTTIPIATPEFENELFENEIGKFNESLSEIQVMLEGTPENALGRHAAERLVEAAIELENRAVNAHEAGRTRHAIAVIYSAQVNLRNAKTILEHANEWEPELRENWANWKETWENMRTQWAGTLENLRVQWAGTLENMRVHWAENVNWQSFIENYNQYRQNIAHQWQGRWQEMLQRNQH